VKKQSVPKQYTRALVDKGSIKKVEKQFDVVFATETPVFRRQWEENFYEILSISTEHMRTERLDGGVVPLLDNHDKYTGVTKQYGSVIAWSISNGECRATIQFSTRSELQGIWDDIEAGIIKGISAAYIPWVYQREIVADRKEPNYRAIDWEVTEISLAPVPADYNSKIRSEEVEPPTFEIEIKNFKTENRNMEKGNTEVVETTGENKERSNASATPNATVVDAEKLRKEAVAAERQRSLDIHTAVRAAKVENSFAEKLVADGVTIDEARAQILNKLAEADKTPVVRTATSPATTITVDEVENTRNAMSDALQHRAMPGSVKLEGKAHDFKYMSMLEMARTCLIAKGEKGNSYSPSETIKRAIATTDYPNLLTATTERSIRRVYEALPAEWKNIASQISAKDFREKTGIAVDGKVTFEEIAEGGEYKQSLLLQDDSAKIKLKTYGRKIKISRQAIINDDLDVFGKLPKLLAQGAANFQADKVWGLITGNAKTPDAVVLFHTATHKNLAGAGAVISETTLAAARTAMYRMKTPAGENMPILPKYLVVPVELLVTAQKLMQSLIASAANDVNTMQGAFQIMTNPRLTNATEWYLAADPSQTEGLVYAYLEGEEGLYIDKEIDFNDDSVSTKARLDFDCQAWDYRGWYKNPGA
jgi:hypothetical protein